MIDNLSIPNNAKKQPCRFNLISAEELLSLPPSKWIIRGVLPEEGFAAIYGPSMSGKSFLAIDLAHAISSGEETWFGHKVYKKSVIYICQEGQSGLGKRVKARNSICGTRTAVEIKYITQPFNLLSKADIEALAHSIKANGMINGVVIIDTLNQAAPGLDENSSSDMNKVITAVKQLQLLIGGLIILIHHTGKTDGRGPRGHSSLFAALDAGIYTEYTDNPRMWSISKSKDDESGKTHSFMLKKIGLGTDEENEEISSCLVKQLENKPIKEKIKRKPKGANQIIAYDAIHRMLNHTNDFGKACSNTGTPCIKYGHALEEVKKCLTVDENRRNERAKHAITSLLSNHFFMHKDDWIWAI